MWSISSITGFISILDIFGPLLNGCYGPAFPKQAKPVLGWRVLQRSLDKTVPKRL